jgi:hypothetical protein
MIEVFSNLVDRRTADEIVFDAVLLNALITSWKKAAFACVRRARCMIRRDASPLVAGLAPALRGGARRLLERGRARRRGRRPRDRLVARADHCNDRVLDGDETDVDCGGSCGQTCVFGEHCLGNHDCAVGQCISGACTPVGSTCSDHVKDGSETDVDCGGGCPLCADGRHCLSGSDCVSGACAAGTCQQGKPPFSFGAPRFSNTGQGPLALVVGDFNGDGHLDLATADYGTNDVGVELGYGDGTFHDPVSNPVGTGPEDLVTADFNGDGRLDLASADFRGSTVSILLGIGDGTFEPATPPTILVETPQALTAFDANGDGVPDLAVIDRKGMLVLLLGKGTGEFAVQAPLKLGGSAEGVAAADLDGNGVPDFACVADYSLVKLLDIGEVTYGMPMTIPAHGGEWWILAADVNLDGRTDLVTATDNGYSCALKGDGMGGFAPPSCNNVGGAPWSSRVADLDRDGKPDVALLDQGTGNVSLLRGHGDATFDDAINLYVGGSPQSIVIGDFNEDGKLDLAICDYFTHDIGVLLNTHD